MGESTRLAQEAARAKRKQNRLSWDDDGSKAKDTTKEKPDSGIVEESIDKTGGVSDDAEKAKEGVADGKDTKKKGHDGINGKNKEETVSKAKSAEAVTILDDD